MRSKLKYSLLYALLLGLCYTPLYAQQLAASSQYLINPYALNTATAGLDQGFELATSYRRQWAGIEQAPSTFFITAHAAINRPREKRITRGLKSGRFRREKVLEKKVYHAVGGFMMRDEAGAFLKTGAKGSYTVNIPLNNVWRLASSMAFGYTRFELDQRQISLIEPDDPLYQNYLLSGISRTVFDGSLGLWIYSSNAYLGYNAEQLFSNDIVNETVSSSSELRVHHFLTAGYMIKANDNWSIVPSFLLRYARPAPLTFDVSVQAEYKEKVWAGLSYRHENALVLMGGVNIKDFIRVGYAYDYPLTEIANYTSGSHEICVSLYGLIMKFR